jgi:hypothetical protein
LGDEIAWGAALLFLASIVMSFMSLASDARGRWHDLWADYVFVLGVTLLTGATLAIGLEIR